MTATAKTLDLVIIQSKRSAAPLVAALREATDLRLAACYGNLREALEQLPAVHADVVLLSLAATNETPATAVRRLRDTAERSILILAASAHDTGAFEAICAGAMGCLTHDTPPARVLDAVRELRAGGAPMCPEIARQVVVAFQRLAPAASAPQPLSRRELETLRLLSQGFSYKTAATRLDVSIDTIRFHVRNIYDKLHVHSKSEAVAKALRGGLLA